MDSKITVNQLAEEFQIESKTILSELKKIGVMVFSANQPIDPRFVSKIQSHLKLLTNITQESEKKAAQQKKQLAAKKKVIKIKPKKVEPPPLEGAISKDMTVRRALRLDEEVAAMTGEESELEMIEETFLEEETPQATVQLSQAEAPVLEEEAAAAPAAGEITPAPPETPAAATPAEVKAPAAAGTPDKSGLIVREIRKEKKKGKVLKKSSATPGAEGGIDKSLGLFKPQGIRKKKLGKKRKFHEVETARETSAGSKRSLKKISVPEGVTVKELCERLEITPKEVLKVLFMKGYMININQIMDMEMVEEIGQELGFEVQTVSFEEELFETEFLESESGSYSNRPPIITVMGHVDHGKTSLLDAIRKTRVAANEAGGITQHIGAYMVEINNRWITFIDTPGHEAFTMMRARGAQVTDIVVLVVAADDGVMPQTEEAIQHARAAGVPIIVAINKIDKPEANPEKVKRQLSELGLIPEDWGGTNIFVEVSAKKLVNIETLLEMILLAADIQELKANPSTKAMGTVIESRLDKSRGPVATLLVQNGTLFERDIIVAGSIAGKIRAMYDATNARLDEAGPAVPVMVLGLEDLPMAGEKFFATDDSAKARQLSEFRRHKQREEQLRKMKTRVSMETLFQRLQEGQIKELPIILKGDVQGSKDALESVLNSLSTEKVKITLLHSAVGAINENDVLLASASNAIVVGFNVKPVRSAEELAARENVDIRFYNIIYTVADEIKKAMEGLLEYTTREEVIGTVEVRDTFRVPSVGMVIGGYVTDGIVRRDARARLFRGGVMVYDGRVGSLKRFKEDVTEVKTGYECGISIENFNDVKVNDELRIYVIQKVKDTLDS